MRRSMLIASLVFLVLLGSLLSGRWSGGVAQDATPMALDEHPLVGAWILDTDTENPDEPLTLATFFSDGVYVEHTVDGASGVGSWEATGPTTANMTFIAQFLPDEEEGAVVWVTVRAEIEVMDDGQRLSATYSVEFSSADTREDQIGPLSAEGERIAVEPIGSDLVSPEEAFGEEGGSEDAAATPEA